jgi:hypothetical protein
VLQYAPQHGPEAQLVVEVMCVGRVYEQTLTWDEKLLQVVISESTHHTQFLRNHRDDEEMLQVGKCHDEVREHRQLDAQ